MKSQEENALNSTPSKWNKRAGGSETDVPESSVEFKEKRQSQSVGNVHKASAEEDLNDCKTTLKVEDEEPLGSSGASDEGEHVMEPRTVGDRPMFSEKIHSSSILQNMSRKEVSNEDQTTNLEPKEGEDPPSAEGGTSLETEKKYRTDTTQQSTRPSPNSPQVNSTDVSPTHEAEHAHVLDLGEALLEPKHQPHTASSNIEPIQGEDHGVIQEPTAAIVLETGRESTSPLSMGPVRPTSGEQEEHRVQESESTFMDTLPVEGEAKQESSTVLDGIQGDNSNGLTMTVKVPSESPLARVGPALPGPESTEPLSAHAEMEGVSPAEPLTVPDSQLAPDQMTTVGPKVTDDPLNGENHSNNNSMKSNLSYSSLLQEYLPSPNGSPKRKLRVIVPERPKNRPQSAHNKKIR
ncbi:hypothetical protein AAFF_G00305330 [Aldrovandia affinis]|uniref:Uncharacterized protein n=1 Tax=Aldrovandia affinis TaxID=143900 RepID=A0AAD7WR83_9TELE|nr:hypothetical protein AAFF_G00305330 [Aldrovandia affinis]